MKNLINIQSNFWKLILLMVGLVLFESCHSIKEKISQWTRKTPQAMYTCPMPADSVFSDKPGKCPKCGMELVKMQAENHDHPENVMYTCPMPEDSVFSNKPCKCPKCGMDLVEISEEKSSGREVSLETLLKPTNLYVISTIPVTAMQPGEASLETDAIGRIAYDTREAGSIVTRVAGRIEKLYVKYRYQKVSKGQHILDIYSPELMTAQQNLLFLVKNDPENITLLEAAKERLRLLGMAQKQISEVMQSCKAVLTMPVYSNYSGHIHEAVNTGAEMKKLQGSMNNSPTQTTEGLTLKEGMYLKSGQSVFSVYNPNRAWAILNIPGAKASSISPGNPVRIVPETAPGKDFRATINFIEPYYAGESKTLTARVYFDNASLKLPIGSQVRATIFGPAAYGSWLPEEAVLSLGLDRVVFLRTVNGFRAQKIETGMVNNKRVQVVSGISPTDSVAGNAQYLMDSESFIKVKN